MDKRDGLFPLLSEGLSKFKLAGLLLIPLFSAATFRQVMLITDMNIMTMDVITIVCICLTVLPRVWCGSRSHFSSENTQSNDAWNNMESNGNEYTASYQFTGRV